MPSSPSPFEIRPAAFLLATTCPSLRRRCCCLGFHPRRVLQYVLPGEEGGIWLLPLPLVISGPVCECKYQWPVPFSSLSNIPVRGWAVICLYHPHLVEIGTLLNFTRLLSTLLCATLAYLYKEQLFIWCPTFLHAVKARDEYRKTVFVLGLHMFTIMLFMN